MAKVTQQVNRVTARIQSTKACSFWAPVPTKGSGETREGPHGLAVSGQGTPVYSCSDASMPLELCSKLPPACPASVAMPRPGVLLP